MVGPIWDFSVERSFFKMFCYNETMVLTILGHSSLFVVLGPQMTLIFWKSMNYIYVENKYPAKSSFAYL